MNEPASVRRSHFRLSFRGSHTRGSFVGQFCVYPCDDPFAQAVANDFPPSRTTPPPNPTAPIFPNGNAGHEKRETPSHAGDDLLNPPYAINNTAGVLSDRTAYVGPSPPTCNSPHNEFARRTPST